MLLSVNAIYENGTLKLERPLPLQEHEKVRVTIQSERSAVEETAGILKWTGDPEVLRRLAEDDSFGIMECP